MTDHDERDDYDDELHARPLAPDSVVRWPASIMWVFGLVQCICTQVAVAFFATLLVFQAIDNNQTFAETLDDAIDYPAFWVVFAGWPFFTAVNILVMKAGNDFRRFRHYGLVVTATVIVLLSIPLFYCAVIQIPLSVWLFVVLFRRDVRARFDAVARGKMGNLPPPD